MLPGDQCISAKVLDPYNLSLNKKYGFLSCLESSCGYALSATNFAAHLKTQHQKKITPSDIEEIAKLVQDVLPSKQELAEAISLPEKVQGLVCINGTQTTFPFFDQV